MGHRSNHPRRPDPPTRGTRVLRVRNIYLGLLFILNALGSFAEAVGIYRRAWWGWPLGVVMAGGAFFMYIESRTIGLPMLNEGWLDPPGVLSLIVEAIFVGVYLSGVRRRAPQ